MTVFRAIGSIVLMVIALFFVLANWACVIASGRNKRKGIDKHYSMVPLASLFTAGIAFLLYPYTLGIWIWIIPVVDIGNWAVLIGLPWAIITGAFEKDASNQSGE